ncbi:type II toxin-antitoxin system PemK/MazF family toxin [Paenibacillus sp. M1]|uniref:Type II toxin-antitoxin system PemK/MazF family toxin n=1 Tax=Paenibacillus haidiansis TaxID=1574488 RepID=A0ABU7VWJ6_9BACL
MMYSQGEILLIPFPYSDLSSTKKRPVLVLSNTEYNQSHKDIVVAAITSNIAERDYLIQISESDLVKGQLKVESGIRVDKIYTFSDNIVIKSFGQISSEKMSQVRARLYELFSILGA